MNVAQWISLAVTVVACGFLAFLIWGYRRELDEVVADLDEARDDIADLKAALNAAVAVVDESRAQLYQLANHVVGTEQPSSGRHARIELEAA